MGMDALDGKLRFSQLLTEVTLELFPEVREQLDKESYLELTHEQIGEIIFRMTVELELFRIIENSQIELRRVQYLISNASKLYSLLEWFSEGKEKLIFA